MEKVRMIENIVYILSAASYEQLKEVLVFVKTYIG